MFYQQSNNNVRLMSSQSAYSSSSEAEEHQTRLQSIWKSIKQTKNLSQIQSKVYEDEAVASGIRGSRQPHITIAGRNEQSGEMREQQLKRNLAHVLQKFQQSQRQIEYLKSEIQKSKSIAKEELNAQKKEYELLIKKQAKKMKYAEKENICDNKEDRRRVEEMSKEIQRLNLKVRGLQHEKKLVEGEVQRLTDIISNYQRKQTQQQPTDWLKAQGKGQQLLQLTEARSTIDRLVILLKKTDEFRQLAIALEDSKGLHYLKNIVKKIKLGHLSISNVGKKTTCSCSASKLPEKLVWSPAQCYKLLLNLKMKHDYLSQDCIEEVLFEMNRIYGAKQEKRIKKLKQTHEGELKQLKKKFQQSYDELLAKKQIHRLRKELKAAKSAHKSKTGSKLQDLRNQGQVQDQLKLRSREVKLLQERVRLLQTQNGFNERSLYWEGALAMIDRALGEIEMNEGGLKQFEVAFRERVDENMEADDWLRSYKQFFERISQINSQLVQKLLSIKQNALRKMAQ